MTHCFEDGRGQEEAGLEVRVLARAAQAVGRHERVPLRRHEREPLERLRAFAARDRELQAMHVHVEPHALLLFLLLALFWLLLFFGKV